MNRRLIQSFAVLVVFASAAVSYAAYPQSAATHVGLVHTNILGITIADGYAVRGTQIPYVSQPGDTVFDSGGSHWVRRNGVVIGNLVVSNTILRTVDVLVNRLADAGLLANAAAWRIFSAADPNYSATVTPTRVYRKSRFSFVGQLSDSNRDAPRQHSMYMQLPRLLQPGAAYTVVFPPGTVTNHTFVFDPPAMRSEAVHVSQAGFHPDVAAKVAFLSCWLGDGGVTTFSTNLRFFVLNDATGATQYQGRIQLARAAAQAEDPGFRNRNYTGTDVFVMDFSALSTPGRYRVYVEGIGCSFPFEISDGAWLATFRVMARGLYHQRSGVALGPPYTDYVRPRCFHPDDGVIVYHSNCGLMDSGDGLNARGTDTDNFGNLNAGRTTQIVANAWGGYFDAGDWDRRIQHLDCTRLLLELADVFSNRFDSISLNIPESTNRLPDIVDEALFNLDCYRRMQTPAGGIRGGIESESHPKYGEGSWQESQVVMAYAPCMWSSYIYAGDAARAACILQRYDPALALVYSNSALRAMAWAESVFATNDYHPPPYQVTDARNRAAIELFRLTGNAAWHSLFYTTCMVTSDTTPPVGASYDQADALFTYLRTFRTGTSTLLKNRYCAALTNYAIPMLDYLNTHAFRWGIDNPWKPIGWGRVSAPELKHLLRAHALSGDPRFLRATLLGLQYATGANPLNQAFTTGLGTNAIEFPLVCDMRTSSQPAPAGITTFGPYDIGTYANTGTSADDWFYYYYVRVCAYPHYTNWAPLEAYFDSFIHPTTHEFTIQQTIGFNAYAWGYLFGSTIVPEPCAGLLLLAAALALRRLIPSRVP